jgi:hypothetical protein
MDDRLLILFLYYFRYLEYPSKKYEYKPEVKEGNI